jgi:hypothetical protein
MGVGRDQEKHPTFSSPSATFCEGKFQKQRIPSTSWFGLNSQSFVPAAAGRPSQQNPYEKDARLSAIGMDIPELTAWRSNGLLGHDQIIKGRRMRPFITSATELCPSKSRDWLASLATRILV